MLLSELLREPGRVDQAQPGKMAKAVPRSGAGNPIVRPVVLRGASIISVATRYAVGAVITVVSVKSVLCLAGLLGMRAASMG